MSVKFYLRSKSSGISSLDIIVRFKGNRYKFPSKISVDPEFWQQSKQRCKEYKYTDGIFINSAIAKIESAYKDTLNHFVSQMVTPTKHQFEQHIKSLTFGVKENQPISLFCEFMEQHIEELKENRAKRSIDAYNVFLNKLKEYEAEKKVKLKFEDIDVDFYRSLKAWFYKQNYSSNYFAGFIKSIKMFMNEANELGVTTCQGHKLKSFAKIQTESDNIYLTIDELKKIHYLDSEKFPEVYRETYIIVKNKFLIGAFTGLRISDFNSLNEHNVKDGKFYVKTIKTKQSIVIPIHYIVKEILDSGFDINTKIAEGTINRVIKDLCCLAEINEETVININVAGKNKEMIYKKWELVSSHTARRSFATNAFKSGIPSISIMLITGHRTEKSFLKYIKISAEENADLLSKHEFFR